MTKLHLYFHTPAPVFKARVNMASATYPLASITFDGVTLGAYTDIEFDSTLLLGTSDGADDLGRVRVQKPASSTEIFISRSSRGIEDGQLDVEDNAYITVLNDFRVWARLPYYDLVAGIDYKDGDVEVGDFNTDLPPLANCGSGFADYIDPSTSVITVEFPNEGVNLSRPMADGATITTYNWDVKDGTITVGTAADDVITATFPAGFRYVGLTVTDSNGVSHSSRCPVLAIDPAADVTVKEYQLNQRLEWKGQTLDVNIHSPLDRSDYPDGTLVMFWWDEPANPGDRSHMKFVGWVDNERYGISRRKEGRTSTTTLHCVDVCGRLSVLPGFPQAISRIEDESPWSYMPSLDMNKSLWYLLFWHSTAVNLADFILPINGDDYDAMRLDASGAALFQQVDSQAQKMVPDHYLTCNAKGQMVFQKDWRLEDVGDRPTVSHIITEDYWNDLQVEYNRHPKVYVLRSGAVLSSTELDENDEIPLVFSIAPSDAEAFGQGNLEQIESEGLALSQSALNKSEGHRYAMLNSRYGDFTLRDPSGSEFWDYEPALFNRVQLNIPEGYAYQRGLDFTQGVGLIKNITINYETTKRGTVVKPSAVWNKEVSGYPAITHIPEDVEDIGYEPPPTIPPPDFGLTPGQDLVAAIDEDGTLYRTTDFQTVSGSGGPTWTQHDLGITDTKVYSFVVDPFSPGYIEGSGTVNGWVVTESDIYRIEDFFGTPSANSVHTFATAIDPADIRQSRTIQASFGTYFDSGDNPWLLVITHYADEVGHTGTWALRSLNGGQTWETETQVTAHYDSMIEVTEPPVEVAVHTSPKIPGLAYTTAYVETQEMPLVSGYKSTDWGETWVRIGASLEDAPEEHQPWWGVLVSGIGFNLHEFSDISNASSTISEDDGVDEGPDIFLMLIPAADTKRVTMSGTWLETRRCLNGTIFGVSYDGDVVAGHPTGFGITQSGIPKASGAAVNGASAVQDFTLQWIRPPAATEWQGNRDGTLTPSVETGHCRVRMQTTAGGTLGRTAIENLEVRINIDEIEMEDGTIYTRKPALLEPLHRPSEAMHVPWLDNPLDEEIFSTQVAQGSGWFYRTLKAAGGALADVSPSDYGPNRSGFGIRAYDSDRSYMVMGAVENEDSLDVANAEYSVFVSSDGGDTWTQVLGPEAESSFSGKRGYSAAFSGSDPDVLFIWGAPDGVDGCISYSDDFGVTIDEREGNLSSFGISSFLGIAGGPTG